ncbi:hypothetical protein ACJRO7_018496 [Eucalyptus globulus]|uniref:Uncharacterized protein n=1 Tax=Eucalyptus globulus TaxID=34317 RepID=A0ABD3KUV9_EUCGL
MGRSALIWSGISYKGKSHLWRYTKAHLHLPSRLGLHLFLQNRGLQSSGSSFITKIAWAGGSSFLRGHFLLLFLLFACFQGYSRTTYDSATCGSAPTQTGIGAAATRSGTRATTGA